MLSYEKRVPAMGDFDANAVEDDPNTTKAHVNGDSHTREELRNRWVTAVSDSEPDKLEPIAIVGISLRLPQAATSPQAFWKMLMEKRSAMTDIPSDRFNVNAFHEPGERKKGVVR